MSIPIITIMLEAYVSRFNSHYLLNIINKHYNIRMKQQLNYILKYTRHRYNEFFWFHVADIVRIKYKILHCLRFMYYSTIARKTANINLSEFYLIEERKKKISAMYTHNSFDIIRKIFEISTFFF